MPKRDNRPISPKPQKPMLKQKLCLKVQFSIPQQIKFIKTTLKKRYCKQ